MCHLVSCLIGYNDCWISWNISINGSCACNYDNIFYTSVKNFTALYKVIIRLVISINPVSHRHTHPCQSCTAINTSRPRLNGHHFQDDIFRCIFLNENVWIWLIFHWSLFLSTVGELRSTLCTKTPLYVRSDSYIRQIPLEHLSYIKQMPLEHLSYIKETSWNTLDRT